MSAKGEIVWELRNIRKAYPGVVANDDVSIQLRSGEIHGLLGENGSGKSTLIKILSGAHQPDAGMILRHDQPVRLPSPLRARGLGIATVFQEFSLIPGLSVAENIYLGRWSRRGGSIDWAAMREGARHVLGRLDIDIDPDLLVGDLPVARQQLVEIAKAMALDASMLILDEPTAALGPAEILHLHALLRRLKDSGCTILYVSHRLDEVTALVDVATILRNGRVVSTAQETRIQIEPIVARIVGEEVKEHYPKEHNATPEAVLEAEQLRTDQGVIDASFVLHRGEVLGLGGVLGCGRTKIAHALFGIDPMTGGRLRIRGREVRFAAPSDAIRAGIVLLTEDRKAEGLFANFDGTRNITIANLKGLLRGFRLDLAAEAQISRDLIGRLHISPAAEQNSVELLSGGNQQKVIIARWLNCGADVFILDEPTQGIDIGAKIAIYRLINELTRAGKAVIFISSDDEELLAMSDRVALVRRGRITRILPASGVSKTDLLQSADAMLREVAA
ncbi:MAG TPA: sugar ABC transporter ATP-binding protein [Dongiaceae bacterium]|jgi:ABC-type sugar transport system ATPase subunit|nr:sugar ABC transporter ATP-binding protein [Dongiaceae bacterium]